MRDSVVEIKRVWPDSSLTAMNRCVLAEPEHMLMSLVGVDGVKCTHLVHESFASDAKVLGWRQ